MVSCVILFEIEKPLVFTGLPTQLYCSKDKDRSLTSNTDYYSFICFFTAYFCRPVSSKQARSRSVKSTSFSVFFCFIHLS
jgi:hypothetical protein